VTHLHGFQKVGTGDLGTADWGCLAGRCTSLCLQAAHGGRAAGGSGKRIRGVFATMRYTN